MGLQITEKFGRDEYLKCLYLILARYGGKTGIGLDKGHLQELPANWASEMQIVDLGGYWEIRRHAQGPSLHIMHKITKIGVEELLIVLWLLLRANHDKVRIRKRELRRVPENWMGMLEIKESPLAFMIAIKEQDQEHVIIDPTAVEMP